MTTLRKSNTKKSRLNQSTRSSLGRFTGRLLLASALGGLAALAAAPQAAQAQFVCVGNTDGAAVGDALAGTSAAGGSADGSGGGNFACGTIANASGGGSFSSNTAIGIFSNASGDNSENVATGTLANANGNDSENTANGFSSMAIGNFSANVATGARALANGSGTSALGIAGNIATGANANASGERSSNVATGLFSSASGNDSRNVAIGSLAEATGDGTQNTAVGAFSSATHANSSAFGAGATTSRANQHVYGTANNTYTMPGITSDASRSAQTGPLEIVTSDGAGNLATDGGEIFKNQSKLEAGVAMSLALENPDLRGSQTFAVAANVGFFEDATALGFSAIGQLSDNLLGMNEQIALAGGVSFSVDESSFGGRTDDAVGGRVGVEMGW